MINQIVTELIDKLGFWDSLYFPLWNLLFESFALLLLLIVLLVPIFIVYYIVNLLGDF